MAEPMWFISRERKTYGPFSSAQLKSFTQTGQLIPDDFICAEGSNDWKRAGDMNGLFPEPPASSAPPPQPASAIDDLQAQLGAESPSSTQQSYTASNTKNCYYCGTVISAIAQICPRCGVSLANTLVIQYPDGSTETVLFEDWIWRFKSHSELEQALLQLPRRDQMNYQKWAIKRIGRSNLPGMKYLKPFLNLWQYDQNRKNEYEYGQELRRKHGKIL